MGRMRDMRHVAPTEKGDIHIKYCLENTKKQITMEI
jgi:hypothetical protein